ncbi:phenylalanine--tRNA ligase subunit alpha [Candidatus Peregrinibacteria bacterium]|nr:phenylalanine--tRNA ligase subunit alpha [Candidatus Peregrinibacteria bacterium]
MSFDEYKKRIKALKRLDELETIEHELFGRKNGALTLCFNNLHRLSPDKKRQEASTLNRVKHDLTTLLEEQRERIQGKSDGSLSATPFDVTLSAPAHDCGHLHLIPSFMTQVEEVFGRMGFDTAYGNEIETEEMNFDLLNFPPDHPARDAQDIFYVKIPNLKKDASKPVLRAHTSPVQLHYMQTHKPPFRMICPGRVYRRDADATHSPVFHQFEGLMIGENISLADMKGVMIAAVKELLSPEITFRFRTGYFPFVEPGLEMDIQWQGDVKDSREGTWLEIAGCGMVHPNVLKNAKIDPKKWQGFAFGFGVERLLMIRHRIPDIRLFYEGDLRFLKQF